MNALTEWGTAKFWGEENKKNFTEVVSDLILDVGEFIGNKMGNAICSGVDAFANWGKSIFGG